MIGNHPQTARGRLATRTGIRDRAARAARSGDRQEVIAALMQTNGWLADNPGDPLIQDARELLWRSYPSRRPDRDARAGRRGAQGGG